MSFASETLRIGCTTMRCSRGHAKSPQAEDARRLGIHSEWTISYPLW